MLQIRYYGDYNSFDSPEYVSLRDEIRKYHIGSVILYVHSQSTGLIRVSPMEVARVANRLQADSDLPLLMSADIERGVATRLTEVPSFPWPMAFGATGDPKMARNFGAVTAREARAVGIHWALAPVADVNTNPTNPTINDRSFGEDPTQVSEFVSAFIEGAHSGGLLVTAKHFPGSGDESVDPHHAIASIDADLGHLRQIEFPPFKAAIAAGADSVMLAHARVPALESDPEKIATVSANVINGTLRQELGFHGVVVTDALEMRGLTSLFPQNGDPTSRAAVDAIKAGCDVLMLPSDIDAVFHSILKAVRDGDIPASRIDDSVTRILEMKTKVGLHKNRFVDLANVQDLVSNTEDAAFAQHVADSAVTLVLDNHALVPLLSASEAKLAPSNHGLVVILLAEGIEDTSGRDFEREIRARRPEATVFRFDGRFAGPMIPELLTKVADASEVVLATYIIHEASRESVINGKRTSYFGIRGRGGRLFQDIVSRYADKTIVVSLGSPYLILSFPEIQTYICAYAMANTSEISIVRALFGEIQNHARLPITLPGVAPIGFSLPWPPQKDRQALQ